MSATYPSIADRMLEPLTACLTPEVAERIVQTRVSPDLQARVDQLANKANEGALTDEERAEYAEFVEWADMIAIFKTQARVILKRQNR